MKKIKIFGILSIFTILFLAFACEKEDVLSENQNLSNKVDIFDKKTETSSEYDRVASNLTLNQSKSTTEIFTEIDAKDSSYLRDNDISSVRFSVSSKKFYVVDNNNVEYEYNMIKNTTLDNKNVDGEVFYSLVTESEAKGPWCKAACYSVFTLMVLSDGPAPFADIIAAIALVECLNGCENLDNLQ
jgi:HD-GYP domain-containing protein (c-di-GMP phosphodiesterase class II)